MSKLRVLVVHHDAVELDRISNLIEKGSHAVLPLEKMTEASEALELQRFDAVVLPENTPAEELAAFASYLRRLENDRRGESRTSILACSTGVTEPKIAANGHPGEHVDALIPEHFEPSSFAATVEQLSIRLSQKSVDPVADGAEALAVFDLDGFKELLGNNAKLVNEIIGLFLEESSGQLKEMRDCLHTGNFDSLAKIAHTLKGSLGTLHAHRARSSALAVEIAAIRQTEADCRTSLERLEADLDGLRRLLIEARAQP
jgi:HPt (histidine-containing phosphotransfer) domain-containing protein/CheY-like chemotaxis protein